MNRPTQISHEFVEFIPDRLEDETLYMSIEYATAQHNCLCGCGNRVITPLTPTDWSITYDGETVSLSPSVGNWSFACRSHYWIRRDRVTWAAKFSQEKINAVRATDKKAKHRYYANDQDDAPAAPAIRSERSWLRRMLMTRNDRATRER